MKSTAKEPKKQEDVLQTIRCLPEMMQVVVNDCKKAQPIILPIIVMN